MRYEQRAVAGLTLLNSFTWEHSLDNAIGIARRQHAFAAECVQHPGATTRSRTTTCQLQTGLSLIYDTPFGRGRQFLSHLNGAEDAVLGGWQISAINTMQAGTPFNLTYTPNAAQQVSQQISATYRGANEYRPDIVPGQKVTQGIGSRAANTGYVNYINFAAFVLPPVKDAAGNALSPFGNASRNPARTPSFYETDLDVNKKFNTPLESLKIEFRAEAYNVFNHTNMYLPNTISGTQGTTTSTLGVGVTPGLSAINGGVPSSGGQISSTFEPRILQFGLKILY